MDCALALFTTGTLALTAPVGGPAGPRDLPHGSLVRTTPATCGEDGVVVEILSTVGWYPATRPIGVGQRACAARSNLAPVGDAVFVALEDAGSFAAGDLLGRVTDTGQCDALTYTFTDGPVPLDALAAVRAVAPSVLAGVVTVRETYGDLFGPIGLHRVPWTDWGRVGLPLSQLSAEAIEAEWTRESLVTPEQRERAVVAEGPAYTHFLGADAPGSDIWASPETVTHLLRLSRAWADTCGDAPGCRLSVGDLSWYNDTRPDPLGHKDHTGACVDVRLFRTDGSRYEAWWNRPDDRTGATAYDRDRTVAFLKAAYASAPVTEVFFNDPAVRAAVPGVKPLKGHDDHVHLCFAQDGARAAK